MGLFDNLLSPLTLAGAAEGAVQGREAQIAQQNAEADRAVRASIASTDLLRARNEALAPFRAEITRQLTVHDAYRPYRQAALIEQYGPHDPRVASEIAAWDATMEPYRRALATDDPDEVARIIRDGIQHTGQLPPVYKAPQSPPAAPSGPSLTDPWPGLLHQSAAPPPSLRDQIAQSFQPPGDTAPAGYTALARSGIEVPHVARALTPDAVNGLRQFAAQLPAAGSIEPRTGAPAGAGHFGPSAPDPNASAYSALFGDGSRPGDIIPAAALPAPARPAPTPAAATTTSTDEVSTGPSKVLPGNLTPPASLLHVTPRFSDPGLAAAMRNATDQYAGPGQHPFGLVAPPAGPALPSGPTSPAAPTVTPAAYNPAHPNPAPRPVAGQGPAGSQNPSHSQGAPFIAQGADGQPVLRVPGVGDVPAVTAQRVLDQAKADPAVQTAAQFAQHMRLVAAQGPGVDPAVLQQANSSYQTAWDSALQKYSDLDKLPADQLNTLMQAYSAQQTAEATRRKTPVEIGELEARTRFENTQTAVLGPKTEAEIAEIRARNVEMLHKARVDDAQAQHEIASAAYTDAQRQNLPAETRIKYIDADMRGRAALLDAKTRWTTANAADTKTAIRNMDPIMGQAMDTAQGADGKINTLSAWMVIKRAEMHPDDEDAQTAKQAALQLLQAATASYYGGHPDLVNGPVPQTSAWTGRRLWETGHTVTEYMNKNDTASKQALESMRAWRAFDTMMSGGSPGTYPKSLGTPGFFTRWQQKLQSDWKSYQQSHPGPFSAWGQPDHVRSFIPPPAPTPTGPPTATPAPGARP